MNDEFTIKLNVNVIKLQSSANLIEKDIKRGYKMGDAVH